MGSSASPETVQWLRELSDPFLRQAEEPGPIAARDFRPGTAPAGFGTRTACGWPWPSRPPVT